MKSTRTRRTYRSAGVGWRRRRQEEASSCWAPDRGAGLGDRFDFEKGESRVSIAACVVPDVNVRRNLCSGNMEIGGKECSESCWDKSKKRKKSC